MNSRVKTPPCAEEKEYFEFMNVYLGQLYCPLVDLSKSTAELKIIGISDVHKVSVDTIFIIKKIQL